MLPINYSEESLENGPYETADEGIPEYDVEELERQEEEEVGPQVGIIYRYYEY